MHTFTKVGLDALLTPENCAVLLIDHQPSQLANVNSQEPTMVINNVTAMTTTKAVKNHAIHTNGREGVWLSTLHGCSLTKRLSLE